MTRHQMLKSMPADEITDWQALYQYESDESAREAVDREAQQAQMARLARR